MLLTMTHRQDIMNAFSSLCCFIATYLIKTSVPSDCPLLHLHRCAKKKLPRCHLSSLSQQVCISLLVTRSICYLLHMFLYYLELS